MNKIVFVFLIAICASCMTYYQKFFLFNQNFEKGKLEEAQKILANDKKAETSKAKLLYYLNRGVVSSMLGNYEESNKFFEEAYILGEDYQKNYINTAVSFLTNPNFVEYKGEDFELIMLHYYKALNYLKLGSKEAALVECRRMNIKLAQLSDKYTSDNKYKRDAFIHLLMGIIYDANFDYNNAFIAYRNALEIYETDYNKLFGLNVPDQLKSDLIRTAYKTGFYEDVKRYEKKFGIKYNPAKETSGDVIFLWHNGLGPVKTEWGINFIGTKGQGTLVNFNNAEFGMNFSFYLDREEDYEEKGLSQLNVLRVVFPKYIERPVLFDNAKIAWQGQEFKLQKVENINAIAFKCLDQRMIHELGKSLLRIALKKAAEYKVRSQNGDLGAAVGILNAVTEQADTRNWQTVPHSIYYGRVSLPEGQNSLNLVVQNNGGGIKQEHNINVNIQAGKTYFHTFHSLEISKMAVGTSN